MTGPCTCRLAFAAALLVASWAGASSARADDAVQILERAERGELAAAIREAESARLTPADRAQLLGHLKLRSQDLGAARAHLARAVELEPSRAAAWLELAVVEHLLGSPRASLEALRQGRRLGRDRSTFYVLAASNLRALEDLAGAWVMIGEGLDRLSKSQDLLRFRVAFALDLGLVEAAVAATPGLLEKSPDADLERRWIARRLVDLGAPRAALPLLEAAHARARTDPAVSAELAWAYARVDQPGAAARALDPRHLGSDRYAYEAAEYYRAAGAVQDALRVNGHVADDDRRLAQRVVLLVADGQAERAVAAVAGRGGGALDDTARFALAWAALQLGRPDRAEALIDQIEQPGRFEDLPRLRAQIRRGTGR